MERRRGVKRLHRLSSDNVLRYHPGYIDELYYIGVSKDNDKMIKVEMPDINIKHRLKLLLRQEIERLSQDPDLMSELKVINDLKGDKKYGVLEYLIGVNPENGMIYGARYGLKNLFHAAKRSYFHKRKIDNWKQADYAFKAFIEKSVIKNSIRGGDVQIFKSCVKYLNISKHDPYFDNFYMLFAISYDRKQIVKYLLYQGASIQRALHNAVDKKEMFLWLLARCYKQHDSSTVNSYLNAGLSIAINEYSNTAFKTYIESGKFDLERVLQIVVEYEGKRPKMVYELLKRGVKDVDAKCLWIAVRKNQVETVNMLLEHNRYRPKFINMFLSYYIEMPPPEFRETMIKIKGIIDALIKHVSYVDINKQMLFSQDRIANMEIFEYLKSKLG